MSWLRTSRRPPFSTPSRSKEQRLICLGCETDKPSNKFGKNRRVCMHCRYVRHMTPEAVREQSRKAWARKGPAEKLVWNQKIREYRAKRKAEGNPVPRNCKSDRFRKSGKFKFWLRAEVFRLKGSCCAYCHRPADQIDHVVALVRGGTDAIDNLVPACRSCNSSKQDKPVEQWLASRKAG